MLYAHLQTLDMGQSSHYINPYPVWEKIPAMDGSVYTKHNEDLI